MHKGTNAFDNQRFYDLRHLGAVNMNIKYNGDSFNFLVPNYFHYIFDNTRNYDATYMTYFTEIKRDI